MYLFMARKNAFEEGINCAHRRYRVKIEGLASRSHFVVDKFHRQFPLQRGAAS